MLSSEEWMPLRMLAETKAACGWFPMRTFTKHEPLTDAELIAGPETVMPSEYYREVFGGEMSDACEFSSLGEANEILGLMMRHWNTIAAALNKDEVYGPILMQDKNGVAHGNDWAHGFMRGTLMRHDGWVELVNDEEQGGCMVPIFMLHYEHDEDPEMRPKPISPEKREEVIVHMAAGLLGAYRYFREQRQAEAGARTSEPRRSSPNVGGYVSAPRRQTCLCDCERAGRPAGHVRKPAATAQE